MTTLADTHLTEPAEEMSLIQLSRHRLISHAQAFFIGVYLDYRLRCGIAKRVHHKVIEHDFQQRAVCPDRQFTLLMIVDRNLIEFIILREHLINESRQRHILHLFILIAIYFRQH